MKVDCCLTMCVFCILLPLTPYHYLQMGRSRNMLDIRSDLIELVAALFLICWKVFFCVKFAVWSLVFWVIRRSCCIQLRRLPLIGVLWGLAIDEAFSRASRWLLQPERSPVRLDTRERFIIESEFGLSSKWKYNIQLSNAMRPPGHQTCNNRATNPSTSNILKLNTFHGRSDDVYCVYWWILQAHPLNVQSFRRPMDVGSKRNSWFDGMKFAVASWR